LSRLSGLLLDCSLPILCALLCCPGATRALFGSFLWSLEGERFPLLGALLRNCLTALCALLCCLGALRSFGLALRLFPQRILARLRERLVLSGHA
jgi:hypothetical protein